MKKELNSDANVVLMESAQALVVMPKGKKLSEKDPKVDEIGSTGDHAEWGDDDLEPQHILEESSSNPLLYSKLDLIVRLIYSGGMEAGTLDDAGEFVPTTDKDLRKFLKKCKPYLVKSLLNLKTLGNVFPKIIFEPGRGKVQKIDAIDASWCRYEKQNKSSRRVENLFVNANLEESGKIGDDDTVKYPIIDVDDEEFVKFYKSSQHKFIYPVEFPTLGRYYYGRPTWDPIRKDWLPYANLIPEVKKALLENGMMIRWLIEIPVDYWEWKYPKWSNFTHEEREAKKKEEMDLFNKFLKGEKNAGKSLMTTYRTSVHNHVEYGRWKFTKLEHSFDDGVLNSDSHEASTHILAAINLDPALAGIIPGSTKAGSGSLNRNAYNIFMAMSKLDQDLVLQPVEWALEYNGFEFDEVRIKNSFIGTLDAVTPKERDVEEK